MSTEAGQRPAGDVVEAAHDHAHCLEQFSLHPLARAAPVSFGARRSCEAIPAVSNTRINRTPRRQRAGADEPASRSRYHHQTFGHQHRNSQHARGCPFCDVRRTEEEFQTIPEVASSPRNWGGSSERRPPFAHLGDTFRCRHCKTLVGPTHSGGRHRNHCPACLFSRHVDRSRPGDRASDCGASMIPVRLAARRDGERLIVHQCQGCGAIRQCRVAADDDWTRVMGLPLRVSRSGLSHASDEIA